MNQCLELLSGDAQDPQTRVLLANIYFLLDCPELAAEEVAKLVSRYPERRSLKKLQQALQPDSVSALDDDSVDNQAQEEQTLSPEKEGISPEIKKEAVASDVQSPTTQPPSIEAEEESDVLAETDFDLDELDLLSDEDD